MTKHFVGIWLLYWATILLLPVYSIHPMTLEAALLQGAFVLLVLAGMLSVRAMVHVRAMPVAGRSDIPTSLSLIRVALATSLLGLLALTYDKIYVQGVDYSQGVAIAREEWRQLGEEREGQASSVFSALGYLLGSAYYVAIVLAITQARVLTTGQRVGTLLAAFALLIANSMLTGGRSNVLLIAAFVVGAFLSRRGLKPSNLFPGAFQRRALKLTALLGLAYTVFIFYQRAEAGDVGALEYALDFLPFLGVEPTEAYRSALDGGALSGLSAMLVLTLSYVTHSFATVAAILEAQPEDKTIIFLHIVTIASKLGLAEPPDGEWFLSGRLPSVPGSLWHQFGWFGFLVGSWLLGMVSEMCRAWTAKRPTRVMPLGAYVMAHATLVLTPALFAGDFLSFPFVLGSFVLIALVDRWLRRRVDTRQQRGRGRRRAAPPTEGPALY